MIHVAAKVTEIKEIVGAKVKKNFYLIYKQFFLNKPLVLSLKAMRAEGIWIWSSPKRMKEESKEGIDFYLPSFLNKE